MNERYIDVKTAVQRTFALPHNSISEAEEQISIALALSYLGYLNDRVPCSEFAANNLFQLLHAHHRGMLGSFYDKLRGDIQSILTNHLTFKTDEEPRVIVITVLREALRVRDRAEKIGRQLVDNHRKILHGDPACTPSP
ncbi:MULTISPECIES: hypothetical protein [unclassified Pseudomonas]|uniref:hypothetical protein n=1 Tax=unclassified Pseudomonas TaxID=196821 RepID=UPI00111446A8|nr:MULTISPECIES: hypothetical protein [unclassified Pseudomonas]